MQINNCIMIVDDNPIDQKITSHLLRKEYQQQHIVLMDNAKAALNFLKDPSAMKKAMPMLILLDMDMPVMDGLAFLQEFAKLSIALRANCKIVVLTASQIETDLASLKANPYVVKLIHKPLKKDSIQEFVA